MTRWIDLILAIVAAEAAGLWWWRRRTGHGPRTILANLAAGAMLLLAMRLALGDGSPVWVGLCLAAGGAAHLLDLRARWR